MAFPKLATSVGSVHFTESAMMLRAIAKVGKWVGYSVAYLLASVVQSLGIVLLLMRWRYGNDDSAALGLVMFMLLALFLAPCLLWGIIYAPALAKAGKLQSAKRVWRHLALSNTLGVFGIALFWLGTQLPLPFGGSFATSAYLFSVFCISLACLVLGVLSRVHLERKRSHTMQDRA
jgi:hypothetical protein